VIHYTATGTVGGESYAWEAYLEPTDGRGRIDVRDAGGTTLYSDVFSGGNLTRFDPATRVYERIAADQLPAESALRSSVVAFFAAGYSYVQAGKLWDVGVGQWRGRTVLQFALTTAPYLTYVYADPATLRIAGASVDLASSDHPGTLDGPSQLASTGACLSYSMVEYLGPGAVPTATFEPTPPLGYTAGQTRAPVTCGG
jgi:hypothetical protein